MRSRPVLTACAIGAMTLATAWATTTTTFSGNTAPSGAHYNNGSGVPSCNTNDDLTVTCSGTVISGVGNTDADVAVSTSYSGVVTCTNHGGNTVDVKTQTTSKTVEPDPVTSIKNGTMTVQSVTFGGVPTSALLAAATCPNGNWKKDLSGTPTLTAYSYTLTFEGYDLPAITITWP